MLHSVCQQIWRTQQWPQDWKSFDSKKAQFSQFSCSVLSDSLQPHELQHTRPPCPPPTPGVYPNSCPLSWWYYPAISSSVVPFSSCPPIPPSIRVFSNESSLQMRWLKYWSFSVSINPSNEHPGLIFFRIDWLDLLAVQETSTNGLSGFCSVGLS